MTTLNQLEAIFRSFFDDDSLKLSPETTANDVPGWDSLSHAALMVAVEDQFNITFSTKELLTFKNVGDLVGTIERKIKK